MVPPELEMPDSRESSLTPPVERRHPVSTVSLRLGEADPLDTSGFDALLAVHRRYAVGGGDLELVCLRVGGSGVELEGRGVGRGEDEGVGERLESERDKRRLEGRQWDGICLHSYQSRSCYSYSWNSPVLRPLILLRTFNLPIPTKTTLPSAILAATTCSTPGSSVMLNVSTAPPNLGTYSW